MGGNWLYSCYFVGRCFQDLFKTARNILVYMLVYLAFVSMRFVSLHEVHPYSSIDTATAWKKNPVLFYRIDQISIIIFSK